MTTEATALSDGQLRVLTAVKRHGDATADDVAGDLGISASAVRQHLSVLRSAGFVEAEKERGQPGQPGRPVFRYRATAQTEPLFEGYDGDVSVELLVDIHHEDPGIVDRVFERRRRRQVATVRARIDGHPIAEQVGLVTQFLDTQGYLADHEQITEQHYRINLRNCPIWNVANRFPQACTAELDLVSELIPEATVRRVTHKTAGAHTCAYDILT